MTKNATAQRVFSKKLLLKQNYSTILIESDLKGCWNFDTCGEFESASHFLKLRYQPDHVTEKNFSITLRNDDTFLKRGQCEYYETQLKSVMRTTGGLSNTFAVAEYLALEWAGENNVGFCRQIILTEFEIELRGIKYWGELREKISDEMIHCD
jgi:hypothetical protein